MMKNKLSHKRAFLLYQYSSMTVVFGKVHDWTCINFGYKVIDTYLDDKFKEIKFEFKSLKFVTNEEEYTIFLLDKSQIELLVSFEEELLQSMQCYFDNKVSIDSLRKLYESPINTKECTLKVMLEEDIDTVEENLYDIVVVCDHVYVLQDNSFFTSPFKASASSRLILSPRL